MTLPSLLAKVVSWLRAGYPDGVPEHDYVPLIALLGSQLTDDIARSARTSRRKAGRRPRPIGSDR